MRDINTMENKFRVIDVTFHTMSIFATICCVSWCISEYYMDRDLSLIEHKTFGEDDNSIMPSFSLCFFDPFLSDSIESNGMKKDKYEYKRFLSGQLWEGEMLAINFENVTKRLEDYVLGFMVIYKNGKFEQYDSITSMPDHIEKPYLSYSGFLFGPSYLLKCYTVDFPPGSSLVALQIKKEIFPDAIRPSSFGLAVSVHYQNQFLASLENFRTDWPTQKEKTINSYCMQFIIKLFEVTVRRNTRKAQCNEKWKRDDFEVFQKWIDKTKCKTPYQTWNTSYTFCDTKEKMAQANLNTDGRKNYLPPCQSVENAMYEYIDFEPEMTNLTDSNFFMANDTFTIMGKVPINKFKAIVHKKAYDLQTLIGNCGGYIGLIVGKR